jgi:hypothetical protein
MKSIADILKTIRDITDALPVKIEIALIGGYALVAHGVERTTTDVDFCLYTESISTHDSRVFFDLLKSHLPARFEAQLIQGSKFPDDPFKHDLIRLYDLKKEFFRIDILLALYKWEVEGIRQAEQVREVPVPVLGKPYLTAMKLQASGYKDAADVVALMALMMEDEKAKTFELAKRIHWDKKLARLLNPPPEEEVRELPEEYL